MAGSKRITKKRKRSSRSLSHSLRGIITRSKSQIHVHRNRSGKSRTHSIGGGKHQDLRSLSKKPRKSSPLEDSVGCDLSSVSIKDLRLRRVFSPSSTDGVIPNCLVDAHNLGKSELAVKILGDAENLGKSGLAGNCLDDADNLGKSELAGDCLDDAENLGKGELSGNCLDGRKEESGNGDFRKSEMSNEELFQSTPPDVEIVGVEQVGVRNEGEKIKKEKGSPEDRNETNYSKKSVLRPCYRVKLFKAPVSFSLKRLLPYLTDIKKECPGSPIMVHCPKTEKGLEEKQLLGSYVEEALGDKSMATGSFTSLVNGGIKKFELQVSTEDQNSNCLKNYSSSTIEDSHFNGENSAGVLSNDKTLADDGEVAKTNVESPCNVQVLDWKFSPVNDYNEVTKNYNEEMKQSEIEDNDTEVVEKVEDLNVQCMPVTPPDSGMISKMETDDSRGIGVDCLSQGTNLDGEKLKNGAFHRNGGHSSPKNKLVPNQQLRPKLCKIPGSFSYRRTCSVEQYTGDGIWVPVTEATAIGCSSNDKLTRSPPKQLAGSLLIPDSQQEHASVIKHAALDANQKLETSPNHVVDSHHAKFANHVKLIEADCSGEASLPIGLPIVSLEKGILKRNPPGCRGICSCLNCTSFRLHAERAFEFSRNQMQDAEEVALDLIKELSFLRNVLEKSASGSNDHPSISINEVTDACKKASEAEERAKARLGEMNYDLNIHCRIPCGLRPSVRFANYVEEQIILIADSSNK
ncbi:hypothetical protein F3Y22_tig00111505pilonHSYRG00048 [Hibiscus syriacus]|uniref:Uncharacterized protein n=1 Tax=Hibiscus syriacus TaxID=106335 RepID=A0A6A2YHY8_HIBSY|nr:hypothetical protein F3Y22_tig00111505pilonHSYRG00048 [Hibiscus syriacus]